MAAVLDPARILVREQERREREDMLALSELFSPPVVAQLKTDPYLTKFSFPVVSLGDLKSSKDPNPKAALSRKDTPSARTASIKLEEDGVRTSTEIVALMTRLPKAPLPLDAMLTTPVTNGRGREEVDCEPAPKRKHVDPVTAPTSITPPGPAVTEANGGPKIVAQRVSSKNGEHKSLMDTAVALKREADTYSDDMQRQIGYIRSATTFIQAVAALDPSKDGLSRRYDLLCQTAAMIKTPKFLQATPTTSPTKVVNGIVWRMVSFILCKQWETKQHQFSATIRQLEKDLVSATAGPSSSEQSTQSTPSPASLPSPQKTTPNQPNTTPTATNTTKVQDYVKIASVATEALQKWFRALSYLPDDAVSDVLGTKLSMTDSYADAVLFFKSALTNIDALSARLK